MCNFKTTFIKTKKFSVKKKEIKIWFNTKPEYNLLENCILNSWMNAHFSLDECVDKNEQMRDITTKCSESIKILSSDHTNTNILWNPSIKDLNKYALNTYILYGIENRFHWAVWLAEQ